MTQHSTVDAMTPHLIPPGNTPRTLLHVIRRLASGGLDDAHATNAMIGTFGLGYRRPLMFLRVLMKEVSRISQRPIMIAPGCCRRMTDGEATFLLMIECGRDDPGKARHALARVTGSLDTLAAVSVAQALAASLEDLGRPIG